jgi:hypothetical protein
MPLACFRALMRQALRKARALESEIKYPRPEGTEVEIVNQPAENVAEPHFYPTHMWREGTSSLKRDRCASLVLFKSSRPTHGSLARPPLERNELVCVRT